MADKGMNKVRELAVLMSVPDILAALGISRDTFYKWRQAGKGPRCFPLPEWGAALSDR
jgi:predicted DNA-binding transcriptional regulator AlpA